MASRRLKEDKKVEYHEDFDGDADDESDDGLDNLRYEPSRGQKAKEPPTPKPISTPAPGAETEDDADSANAATSDEDDVDDDGGDDDDDDDEEESCSSSSDGADHALEGRSEGIESKCWLCGEGADEIGEAAPKILRPRGLRQRRLEGPGGGGVAAVLDQK